MYNETKCDVTIQVITYEEERLEFFLDKKAEIQKKIDKLEKQLSLDESFLSLRYEKINEYARQLNFYEDAINALISQDKQRSIPLYIRFGNIPTNEQSKVYLGDQVISTEPGVSVWRAIQADNNYYPLLPADATQNTITDYFDLLLDRTRPVFLVTGDELRVEGKDREPLIQNVKIIKEITATYRSK